MSRCAASSNRTIVCKGELVPSEGCCLRHAVLFDYWISDHGGHRVYASPYPRRWKRSKFHQWLNTLTVTDVERIEQS